MSTIDGAIDQNLSYDLEWIYHCLIPRTVMHMKHLASKSDFSTNKQRNGYSNIIDNFKYE